MRVAINKGVEVHLEEYLAKLETLLRHRDMRGLYKHLYKHLKMTAGLGGRETEGQQAIKDENGNLLRDKGDILRRWERFFGNLSFSTISTPFSSVCGEGRKSHRSGKTQRSRCSTRSRTDPTATTSEGFHSSPTPAKYC